MPALFDPFVQKSMQLRNRIILSPMCMHTAGTDGIANDWHFVHLATRALGGAGLIITEASAVEPVGRISESDLGLWNDDQAEAFARMGRFIRECGAAWGIQLAHAGRKAWTNALGFGPETPVAPSPIPWGEGWITPIELDHADIDRIVAAFGAAAARAGAAGCDMVEIHGAHGYLVHEFLSPISNQRQDEYGGSLANRTRLLRRIYESVRANFPEDRPVWVRISASDWVDGGWDIDESVELAAMMKTWGVDLVDCSSGGNSPLQKIPLFQGYQVPFAERVRAGVGISTGAVGLVIEPAHADQIVRTGQADVVLLGRALLRHPYWPLEAAHVLGTKVPWPVQYVRGRFPESPIPR